MQGKKQVDVPLCFYPVQLELVPFPPHISAGLSLLYFSGDLGILQGFDDVPDIGIELEVTSIRKRYAYLGTVVSAENGTVMHKRNPEAGT